MKSLLALCVWIFVTGLTVAQAEVKKLTVYTYDSFNSDWGPGPRLKAAFESNCRCELEWVSAEDGVSLLNRLRLEGPNTRADVVVGLDTALTDQARQGGLVQAHGIETSGLSDAVEWNDPYFLPFDYGVFAFVYNREKVTEPARSLAELLDSDSRIIYQDPRTSTPGQGLMVWINTVYGDGAEEAWLALKARTVTVTSGWSEAYSMFLAGEGDYVLSYTTSPAYHLVAENDDRFRAATFEEGHIQQIEVAAIGAHPRNPELAREFLKFLISPAAQEILPVTNWMLPVIDSVSLPDAFSSLANPKILPVDWKSVSQQRREWTRAWRDTLSR